MQEKIKVLILEDEVLIAENIRLTLEDLGFEAPSVCNSYNEFTESINKVDFDIALLDINLGDISGKTGFDAAKDLSQLQRKIPFIFLTAYNDKETILKAATYKPAGYITKPVNAPSLFANLQIAIENFITKQEAQPPHTEAEAVPFFFIKHGKRTYKVFWNEVELLESMKNYVKIVTPNNKSGYLVRGSLNYVMEKLMPLIVMNQFVRISRAISIRKEDIISFDEEYVYTDNEKYESSKSTYDTLKSQLQTNSK